MRCTCGRHRNPDCYLHGDVRAVRGGVKTLVEIDITSQWQYGITPDATGALVITTPDLEANLTFATAELEADFLQTLYMALLDRVAKLEKVSA